MFASIVLLAFAAVLIPYLGESYTELLKTVNYRHALPEPPAKPIINIAAVPVTHKGQLIPTSPTNALPLQAWLIQAGLFKTEPEALALTEELKKLTYPAFIHVTGQAPQQQFIVYIGPTIKRHEAENLLSQLSEIKIKGSIINYDPTFGQEE